MLHYAITDGNQYGSNHEYRLNSLVHESARWAADGVDFIQIREKDLGAGELVGLVRRVVAGVRGRSGSGPKVLVSARVDVAVAAGADGVHLTAAAGELGPGQVREIFRAAGRGLAVVSVSCHTLEEVRRASAAGADAILYGPVFGKVVGGVEVVAGVGVEGLRLACEAAGGVDVFALGGVSAGNAGECLAAGAVGVAGIRFFCG